MKTLVACLLIPLAAATYIESVAANVDAASRKQDKFVPLVAFECGYRNRYMGEDGHWKTDDNRYATCQTGKLDILKYCKKSYPLLNVTNIVEYSHEVTLDRWCREEGSPCHYTRTTRPYQCIVGEFRSEALQVPHDCRFSHVSNRHACNDYNHWKLEAATQCANKKVEGRPLSVRSFAVLEPCGLDLFTGVEFVCCPSVTLNKDKVEKVAMTTAKPVTATEEDEDDDDEYSDEDDSEDDEESTETDKKPATAAVGQDPYFTHNEPAKEHENFKEAEERLEKSYHEKINKVMKEWAELEAKYKKMAAHDPSGAAAFKTDMTSRFQKTVASLEDENKAAKKELETVHEERVQATLNEKKRQATHDYRQALALHVGTANKHNVLKTLKTYIRAEEKDRLHMLNRYRHVLRVDQSQAAAMKPVLLHRLRYIDLRINGTMAMLRDFPDLEKNVRPIATTFWTELRRENTPELTDAELDSLEGLAPDTRNKKLVDMYKRSFDKLHSFAKLDVKAPAATTPAPTTTEKTKVLDSSVDSEEEDDEYYEDEDDEEVRKRPAVVAVDTKPAIHVEPIVHSIVKPAPVDENKAEKKDAATQTSAEEDDSTSSESASTEEDEDDEEEEDEDDKSSELKELRVDIEPIIKERPIEERRPLPAYLRQERLIQTRNDAESSSLPASSSPLFLIAAAAVLTLSVFAVAAIRRKRQHHGFIEVDVCTPEERHVSGMQVTGYENPTYSFFDSKA